MVCAAEMQPLRRDRQVKRPNGGGGWPPLRLRRIRWRFSSAAEKGKSGVPSSHWESEVSSLEITSGVVKRWNRRTLSRGCPLFPFSRRSRINAYVAVRLRSSDWRPLMDIGLRAKRNPTATAASMVGRRGRTARLSARCPKAAGKATELGREATRSAVAHVQPARRTAMTGSSVGDGKPARVCIARIAAR
jgi:hypothetical protein